MSTQILVVDDDPAIRTVVAEVLADEGYAIRTASNGEEALRTIDEATPALVLLDMRMPVMDGWGFASALRDRGFDLPILVMTAAQDAAQWAREVGAVGALAKPFDLNDLLDIVERTLRSR